MRVTELEESVVRDIGHAFGYYDYGDERGMVSAFSWTSRIKRCASWTASAVQADRSSFRPI